MIPIRLSISGFLSYREPVELDFTSFDLACIAGPNGAGKSSLLDAITWALFGQARKRDDSIINARSAAAEVGLIFAYEGNLYQVQRTKPREKTMLLEFQILQGGEGGEGSGLSIEERLLSGKWKPLSERTLRETEARIQETLRMDYETFTNASFFLQGKADQFTQQRPGDRKRILTSILGLEVWERYKERAAERRKGVEAEIRQLDGRLQEINAELSEEEARVQRLSELEADLGRLGEQRSDPGSRRGERPPGDGGAQRAGKAGGGAERARSRPAGGGSWRWKTAWPPASKRKMGWRRCWGAPVRSKRPTPPGRQPGPNWSAWRSIAGQFRQQEKEREAPRLKIQAARSRLEQEQQTLLIRQVEIEAALTEAQSLRLQAQAERTELAVAEARLERRARLDESLQEAPPAPGGSPGREPAPEGRDGRAKGAHRPAESGRGRRMPAVRPAAQSSTIAQALVERLQADGTEMGDRYRPTRRSCSSQTSWCATWRRRSPSWPRPKWICGPTARRWRS